MTRTERARLNSILEAAWSAVSSSLAKYEECGDLDDLAIAILQDVQADMGMYLVKFEDGPAVLTIDEGITESLRFIEQTATDLLEEVTEQREADNGRESRSRESRRGNLPDH